MNILARICENFAILLCKFSAAGRESEPDSCSCAVLSSEKMGGRIYGSRCLGAGFGRPSQAAERQVATIQIRCEWGEWHELVGTGGPGHRRHRLFREKVH